MSIFESHASHYTRAEPDFAFAPSLSAQARRKLFRLVLFAISGILVVFALGLSAKAAGTQVLVIPPDDGYGFQECLSSKSACGLVVADSWCEAHGLEASTGFGPAEDIGSIAEDSRPANVRPGSFLVACGGAVN